jgi:rRNA maturation protein Nop10
MTFADTYEHEGPKCPYCGRQYTADDPAYFDEMNYTEEDCDSCGKTFDVAVYHTVSWTCSARVEATTPTPETTSDGEGGAL